ncbi:MAG: hypothetical protein JWL72_2223 [Ilumatobacteraceae bacterium]|nr:hypothetical protein [Ilumatobacteraceae bacterium]MCU1388885.1 hypothetical protein [Ilumatobacteraceae bacterium]
MQVANLPIHVVLTLLLLAGPVGPLLIGIAVGFALEVPQVIRGLSGKPPYAYPRFLLLGP